jgi:hypothetical protein
MIPAKTFLTTVPDDGSEHRSHGYPDECYSLTTFADSPVALAYESARRETNEQNAFIERHMLFMGTAMLVEDVHREVIEQQLDVHSCHEKDCAICAGRFSRGLAEAFQILADGTARLQADAIDIRWHDLSEIPALDLEANRAYSIWDGTPKQADDFLATFWGPPWKK